MFTHGLMPILMVTMRRMKRMRFFFNAGGAALSPSFFFGLQAEPRSSLFSKLAAAGKEFRSQLLAPESQRWQGQGVGPSCAHVFGS